MAIQALLVWMLVGLVAGWLASLFLGGKGLIRYIIVGMIGSIVGGYLFAAAGIDVEIGNKLISDIIVAAVGAVVVILIARIIAK